ncbi:MAG: carboxypeptidase regulatory-like domain-containing protein [Bacteroidales bacterium]|jgi:hypothetical protein|nr:carboxypeptidase regulatory-like domain-containing protein [Bacteroidales bacterium]
MKKFLQFACTVLCIVLTCSSYAQVTTGSITGTVKNPDGHPLEGATVKVTHTPSGTVYHAVTSKTGRYTVNGMRVGSDYVAEFSSSQLSKEIDGIYIALGSATVLDVTMSNDVVLEGVNVTANASTSRNGTATSISNVQIQELPTINRSINDFTKLTPQSNGGNSFAGRDGRYNYITVDGSAFNNNFGLSGTTRNLPGGDAQPISLDAIDQIEVNVAPFDIRQSNFTGASVNAVTKSGDNTFRGTVYTYFRPKSFSGNMVDGTEYEWEKTSKQTYGASLGGPILKNKLFFFINGEYERSGKPSTPWKTSTNGVADPSNYISRANSNDLFTLQQYLMNTYGYDAGGWDWEPFTTQNYKVLGRIDWNITDNHKLTVRYNEVVSTNDVVTNATSAPTPRLAQGRISEYGMAFRNSGYGFENSVRSATAELNSSFGPKFSNKFLASYTAIRDKRTSPSEMFPFVDIMKDGNIYTSFGYELYTYNNDVKNNIFSVIDNFTTYLGDHTITAGASYEQMYFGNAYLQFGSSYYRYNSMEDFMNNEKPAIYAQTVGLNGNTNPYNELNFGTIAAYIQDEWQIRPNFELTGGVRIEVPLYLNKLVPNDASNAIGDSIYWYRNDFYQMNVNKWPKSQVLVSPRIAFNWEAYKKGKIALTMRGGTGIFTGRLPFVWFTNQATQSGTVQFQRSLSGAGVPDDLRFEKDIFANSEKYANLFTPTSAPSNPAEVSKDFKMPQVWRTNLALDIKLPWEMIFTVEGLFTKDINAIIQTNVNEALPDGTFSGSDNRPRWTSGNRINGTGNAMVLGNTNKGYQYSITAMLQKNFSHGFTGLFAYTFSQAKDVTSNPGDQAASAWQSNVAIGSLNDPILSYSNFSIPHRIISSLSYKFSYLKSEAASTTISLFYEGSPQGRRSYVYSNDMNGDGNSSDLMYIPKNASDIIFSDAVKDGVVLMTAQEQSDAFFKFVEQDKYLSSRKGQYAERFGAVMPWVHQFNLKITQDFVLENVRKTRIQITFDILNLGNLINSKWGVRREQITGSYENIPLLQYAGVDANNHPTYQLPTTSVANYYTETYKNVLDYTSTWAMQLGLRFIF